MSALHTFANSLNTLMPWCWIREDLSFGIRLAGFDLIASIGVMGTSCNHTGGVWSLGSDATIRFSFNAAAAGTSQLQDVPLMRHPKQSI